MPDTVIVDEKPLPRAPMDEAVKLPKGVAEAAARANAFYQQPEPAPTNAPEPPPPSAEAAPEPPQPGSEAAPEPPVTAAVTEKPRTERDFKAMQGRLAKSQQQIAEMSKALQAAQDRMRQMAVQQQQQQPQQRRKLITPQEEHDYGTEFLTVVKKAAQEDIAPVVASLQGQIQGLQSQLSAERHKVLYTVLDASVPEWRKINVSPQFLQWLALPDQYSGAIRKTLLTDAFNSGDAGRVARFFQGFLSEEATATGASSPQSTSPQSAPQPSPAAQRQAAVDLGTLIAPGRARTTPDDQSAPSQKPTFTRADIDRFYRRVREGYYRGRDQEKDTLERSIFDAQRDGRVR